VIIACSKLWYFAQAFESTGAMVLMIENIIQDCLSFVKLVGCALIGFGLALYVALHYSLSHSSCNANERQEGKCEENEIKEKIDMDYGSPWKAILTLFYANNQVTRYVSGLLSLWICIPTYCSYCCCFPSSSNGRLIQHVNSNYGRHF